MPWLKLVLGLFIAEKKLPWKKGGSLGMLQNSSSVLKIIQFYHCKHKIGRDPQLASYTHVVSRAAVRNHWFGTDSASASKEIGGGRGSLGLCHRGYLGWIAFRTRRVMFTFS